MNRLLLLASVVSAFACSWDYPIWIPRSKTAEPLYKFSKGDKAGYIDASGHIVIVPVFKFLGGGSGGEFHDGLVEVGVSDGVYADRTGRIVLNKGLYRGWDFSDGLAVAMRKGEELWGYIDTFGAFAIPPQFATYPGGYVYPFSEGLAKIEVKRRFGYIDKTGKFAILPKLLDGGSFSDGMATVVMEGPCAYNPEGGCGFANPVFPGAEDRPPYDPAGIARNKYPPCKFTYVDREGHILAQRYDSVRDFSEGFAPVRVGKTWGFIDKSGTLVIAPKFDDAEGFHGGLAKIAVAGLFGYADKSGAIVIAPQFKDADSFSDDFAPVGDSRDHHWFIDQRGTRAFKGDYWVASIFFKGLAHVRLLPSDSAASKASFAYIDTKGRRVFTY